MATIITYLSFILFLSFNILLIYYSFLDQFDKLPSKFKTFIFGCALTLVSVLIVTGFHKYNFFDVLEYKLFDYRMQVRGYLSGELSLRPIPKESEQYNDLNNNNLYDIDEPFTDKGNGVWDKNEKFKDLNSNGIYDVG